MAEMVGVWAYAVPRPPTADLELLGGITIILDAADKQKLGDHLLNVKIRVKDWDEYSSDDLVQEEPVLQLGPASLNVGPNTFGINSFLTHDKLAKAEGYSQNQDTVELYFRVQAMGDGVTSVKSDWVNSNISKAKYR